MTSLMGSRFSPIAANLRGWDFRADLFTVGRAMASPVGGVGEAGRVENSAKRPESLTRWRTGADDPPDLAGAGVRSSVI